MSTNTKEKTNLPLQILVEKALQGADIDPQDWFESCGEVNNALDDIGITNIRFDWYSSTYDGAVHCSYYSQKIHNTITLDSDVNLLYDDINHMAASIIDFYNEASKLEAQLPQLTYL